MVGIVDLEWIVEDGTVLVIFRRPSIVTDIENVSPNVSPNVPIKSSLNERQRKIKAMICDGDTVTVAKIAKTINVTPRTIYRDLKQMSIRWEGHTKTGHWILNKQS